MLKCVNDVRTLNYWWITHAPLFLEKLAIANSILSTAFYNKIMHTKTWKFISMIRSLHYIDIKFPILRSNIFISMIRSLHYIDIKFLILRLNVFISTIKRLRYIDIKFPILRSNVFIPSMKRFRFYMENIVIKKGTCIFDKTKSPQNILNYAFHH